MFDTRRGLAVLLAALVVSTGMVGTVGAQSSEQVTLTVTVVDSDDEPLGNTDLIASWDADGGESTNETTRANGQVLIDVPRGADVTITIQDDQYVRNEPFAVEDASGESVSVPVSEGGTATIEAVDSEGPVENAVVQIFRSGTYVTNTRVNQSGLHTTPMIEEGNYALTVLKSGYLRNRTSLTVDGDVRQQVQIEQASRLVTFSVTDDHFDEPRSLSGATITVAGNTITTLSNGEATIQLPVNSNYDVEVTRDGYETVTSSLRVREDRVQQNISIQRTDAISVESTQTQVVVGQSVQVTVTDEYGEIVENATLSIAGQTVGQTDENGGAAVPIDSAGEVEIEATSADLTANATVEGVDPDPDTPTSTPTPTATPTSTATATATATATEPPTTTEPTSLTGPGFTGLGALVAGLLAVALLARRR